MSGAQIGEGLSAVSLVRLFRDRARVPLIVFRVRVAKPLIARRAVHARRLSTHFIKLRDSLASWCRIFSSRLWLHHVLLIPPRCREFYTRLRKARATKKAAVKFHRSPERSLIGNWS